MRMTLFEKVVEIYKKYHICTHCLGRMFSLLGTQTSNFERGNALLLSLTLESHANYLSKNKDIEEEAIRTLRVLAENGNYLPAQKVLEQEGFQKEINPSGTLVEPKECVLCRGIFEDVQKYVLKAKEAIQDYEFNAFLVGCVPDPYIVNQEDKFKSEFNLLESEAFKNHFNRIVGKEISTALNKPVDFAQPDIVFVFDVRYDSFSVSLVVKSLFIAGKYNKLVRGIPQTRWICSKCQGQGCELCDFKGKMYETSVEELTSPEFVKESQASGSKFHGAGREDIDVRALGSGRPFILELKNPKKRTLDLKSIEEKVNASAEGKVKIADLKLSNKKSVIAIKSHAEIVKKKYIAIVESEQSMERNVFEEKVKELNAKLENQKIHQQTPTRVLHRRADKVRIKTIYKIETEYLAPNRFKFEIETQGGTYIKELIHGDSGRTTPSIAEIFGVPLVCKELDVINIGS